MLVFSIAWMSSGTPSAFSGLQGAAVLEPRVVPRKGQEMRAVKWLEITCYAWASLFFPCILIFTAQGEGRAQKDWELQR